MKKGINVVTQNINDFHIDEHEGYESHKCNRCYYFRKYEGEEEPNCKACEFIEGAVDFLKWDNLRKCK